MTRFTFRFFVALVGITVFSACQKEEQVDTAPDFAEVSNFKELVVPDNFNFSTEQNLNYRFQLVNSIYQDKYRLELFQEQPNATGNGLIQALLLSPDETVSGNFKAPATVTKMYLRLTAPDGSSTTIEKDIQGAAVEHVFGASQSGKKGKAGAVSPSCASGCDEDLNQRNQNNISINGNQPGKVFCLSDKNINSININKPNVTLRLCGRIQLNSLNLNNGSSLEITDGAQVVVNTISLNSANGAITVYDASLRVKRDFRPNGKVINYGSLQIDENMAINGQGSMTNNGSILIDKKFDHNGLLFTNNGQLTIKDRFTLNGISQTINQCNITVAKQTTVNSSLENHGLLSVDDKLVFNGGGGSSMHNGAMISAREMTFNAEVKGVGTTSLLKLTNNKITRINGGGKISGSLDLCDDNGIETNTGRIEAPAQESCNAYIPTSNCNPEGNGTPQVADADGDGVADENDLYPNDSRRAAESFYPASNSFATLAFEDLWPFQGDYDFNDLVIDYQYKMVLNANNDVVDVEAQYVTRAIGGAFKNGFGIQLEVAPAAIASISGQNLSAGYISTNSNGTESGQAKAVVIIYDDATEILTNRGGSFVNTVEGNPFVVADTQTVRISFSSAQNAANLGGAPYNPFIIVDQDRGKEIHLSDEQPTDLANTNLLGTGDDNSSSAGNRYYKTEGNLPWAINVTTGFAYPEEKKDILTVYNFFDTWAQSGGLRATDWAQDAPGYITDDVFSNGL